LRNTVKNALLENNRIVLDLGEVNYMDSGGLDVLVELRTSAQNVRGAIKLTSLTKHVSDLLQITKLITVFRRIRLRGGGRRILPQGGLTRRTSRGSWTEAYHLRRMKAEAALVSRILAAS
jgi:ABC-type transporter Mla MlaB component